MCSPNNQPIYQSIDISINTPIITPTNRLLSQPNNEPSIHASINQSINQSTHDDDDAHQHQVTPRELQSPRAPYANVRQRDARNARTAMRRSTDRPLVRLTSTEANANVVALTPSRARMECTRAWNGRPWTVEATEARAQTPSHSQRRCVLCV